VWLAVVAAAVALKLGAVLQRGLLEVVALVWEFLFLLGLLPVALLALL
jgi:hypothetical protein